MILSIILKDCESPFVIFVMISSIIFILFAGVLSTSSYAEYQVSFVIEDAILKLQAGIMVNEGVISGSYSYFSFSMPMNKQALRLLLTASSGDPDLFVSTRTSHPTMSNNTWKSVQYGQDAVIINPRQDKTACWGCTYYIGVYGFEASTFRFLFPS